MTDVVVPNTPRKVSAFARRDPNLERIKQDEQEVAEFEKQQAGEQQEPENTAVSPEEATFKKRYGDLRAHSQRKEKELSDRITALERQLQEAANKEIKFPKSEEEIAEWAARYPDVAQIVETIAMKKAREQAAAIEGRLKEVDDMKAEAAREKAEARLMQLHPDFDEIRETQDFHDWVDEQPRWIKEALYDNETDAASAARAIDLYKADKGITKGKTKTKQDDIAARHVSTSGSRSQPTATDTSKIYESKVAKMSSREYEAMEDQILEAMRTGNFVYDLSAGAR